MKHLSTKATNDVQLAVGNHLAQTIPEKMFPGNGKIPPWKLATELFVSGRERDCGAHLKFSEQWTKSVWHRLYEVHKEACFDGCTNFVLFVFSGDYEIETETFLPPVNYFHLLQKSKEARKKRLDRLLRDKGASSYRIRIIGSDPRVMDELSMPTYYQYDGNLDRTLTSQDHTILGYPRLFLGVYMSADISKKELYKVVKSHQDNCPIASEEERIDGQPLNDAVINEHIWEYNGPPLLAKDDESQDVIKMMARRIPTLANKTKSISDLHLHRQKTAAMIEAGNWEPCRISRAEA